MNSNAMVSDRWKHPCFSPDAKGAYGRIHLPVAARCNIQCKFCDRKYDCANESRPGVTSSVLSPWQAIAYLEKIMSKRDDISVAGIAGPGDPFANPSETMETLRLVKQKYPGLLLCLATNGFGLLPFLDEINELGVSHVSITVNAVDPEVGAGIYSWVRDGSVIYGRKTAASELIKRQSECIRALKKAGVTVKINTIIIPGINDGHAAAIAAAVADLGADMMNCIPLFPVPGTEFGGLAEPRRETMAEIRSKAGRFLPQLEHCTRCRADAAGRLNEQTTDELRRCLTGAARLPLRPDQHRPNVAIASCEGVLVNQHLGEAESLLIFERIPEGYRYLENRKTPLAGSGPRRWKDLAFILKDCHTLLVSNCGSSPREALNDEGIRIFETSGLIEHILDTLHREGKIPPAPKNHRAGCGDCSGSGMGCG